MEIDKRISELQELIYRKYSFEKKLSDVNEQYYFIKDRLRDLVYKLENMDYDIKALDKKSIIYLWYEIFISQGKNISKLEYEYKMLSNLHDYIRTELNELNNKFEKITESEALYKQLIESKQNLSLNEEKEKADKLQDLELEAIKYKSRIRDINEAINSSVYLSDAFKQLVDLLQKTKDWDNLDIFGRGLFMSITKTLVFKQTDEKIKKLHYLANRLIRELKVINFYMDLRIDINAIIKYLDYFEKHLYDDIKDKTRLPEIIKHINQGYEIVNDTINNLRTNKETYLKELINIEKNKQEFNNS